MTTQTTRSTPKRRGRPPKPTAATWAVAIKKLKHRMAKTMAAREGLDTQRGRGLRLEQKRDELDHQHYLLARQIITEIAKGQPAEITRFINGFLIDMTGTFEDAWCDWWATERKQEV